MILYYSLSELGSLGLLIAFVVVTGPLMTLGWYRMVTTRPLNRGAVLTIWGIFVAMGLVGAVAILVNPPHR